MGSTTTVEVRPAAAADADGLARVHTLSWRQGYAGLLPAPFLAAREVTPGSWFARLAPRPGTPQNWVAVEGSEVVGFATAGRPDPEKPAGWLHALYVLASHWGRGVGHRLHGTAVAGLRQLGCTTAGLHVLEGNTRATGFYLRQGWQLTPTVVVEERAGVTLTERRMHHPDLAAVPPPPTSLS